MAKRKAMLSVVFLPYGRFHIQALPYGNAITSDSFVEFLKRCRELWRKKRVNPISLSLQIDNAPGHTAKATTSFLGATGLERIKQSPYSPDLNLCGSCLFRALKHYIKAGNMHFNSSAEFENAKTQFMSNLNVVPMLIVGS